MTVSSDARSSPDSRRTCRLASSGRRVVCEGGRRPFYLKWRSVAWAASAVRDPQPQFIGRHTPKQPRRPQQRRYVQQGGELGRIRG
jgi:hypothetical protein